jgi:phage gp45-like
MISLIRGIITKFTAGKNKVPKFSATGRSGETFTDREAFQQFGFASGLPKGTEAILIKTGQNVYLIASENRKFRLDVQEGEVGIYNEDGDNIHLKKGHTIEVNATGMQSEVIINAGKIYLGDKLMATAGGGVVTMNCACITGGKHAQGSHLFLQK